MSGARPSARADARAADHQYRIGARVPPRAAPRPLSELEITIGLRVLARGEPGEVEAIVWSMATNSTIYVVAHDPRIRLPYRACELTAAPLPEGPTWR